MFIIIYVVYQFIVHCLTHKFHYLSNYVSKIKTKTCKKFKGFREKVIFKIVLQCFFNIGSMYSFKKHRYSMSNCVCTSIYFLHLSLSLSITLFTSLSLFLFNIEVQIFYLRKYKKHPTYLKKVVMFSLYQQRN